MTHFEFAVGDGVTVCFVSDRHAGTVIAVSKKRVTVQRDTATVVAGSVQDGSAVYRYERNPAGIIEKYSLRNNHKWIRVGDSLSGDYIVPGRYEYYDPHF